MHRIAKVTLFCTRNLFALHRAEIKIYVSAFIFFLCVPFFLSFLYVFFFVSPRSSLCVLLTFQLTSTWVKIDFAGILGYWGYRGYRGFPLLGVLLVHKTFVLDYQYLRL